MITLINDKSNNKDIKLQSLGLLPELIKNSKETNKDTIKQIFGILWENFIFEKDSAFKSDYCY